MRFQIFHFGLSLLICQFQQIKQYQLQQFIHIFIKKAIPDIYTKVKPRSIYTLFQNVSHLCQTLLVHHTPFE